MKLSEYKKDYYEYTGLASNAVRQLAFAGIALVWIFKTQTADGSFQLPNELIFPSIFLIASLGSDLLQYVAGSLIWRFFWRHHEKKRKSIDEDPNLEAPSYYTWPMYIFFYIKITTVLIAYYLLLSYAISSIKFN